MADYAALKKGGFMRQKQKNNFSLRIRCDLADGCVVMATVDDMFHIIFNLIENAIKYNVTGGSVFLSLRGDEDEIKFTVEDTGIGIPEEDRYNIFTRFYRVDKARSREAGGSGLGLSIVHDAVKVHGGSKGIALYTRYLNKTTHWVASHS